ncbi:hypothetical protein M3Y99_01532600 [Aphelenchoides fujianensis]|nr:hypothetical protein M3Y99_01532600 [Aphelenchoides fujianensis]
MTEKSTIGCCRKRVEEAERADGRTGTVASFLRLHEELRAAEDPIASFGFSSRDLFEFLYEISAAHTPDLAEERLEVLRVRLFDQKTPVRLLFELLDAKGEEEAAGRPPEFHRSSPSSLCSQTRVPSGRSRCANALTSRRRVFVGDMAGFFVIVEAGERPGARSSSRPEAAIIAECVICGEKAVFCTVDGRVHLVDTSDGRFVHSAVQVGESIRAAPRPLDLERLFVATFAPHLTLVDVNTRRFEAVCDLEGAPIRNAPLISADFVLVCTIDGQVGGFRRSSLKIRWRRRFATSTFVPLFSLPDDLFGLLTLAGDLHVMRAKTGELVRTLQLGESCSTEATRFGSFLLVPAGSNAIHSITVEGDRYERQRFELPALKHQSGIVSLGERHAIKCTVDGDPFGK